MWHAPCSTEDILKEGMLVIICVRNGNLPNGNLPTFEKPDLDFVTKELFFFNRSHPDVFVLMLKIRISQNTSIYCQYVSWQIVSTIYSHRQANTEPLA